MSADTPRFKDIAAPVAANGYAVVPLEWRDKKPCKDVKDWPRYRYAPGDERRWPRAGLGILCGDVAAVDIDICDERLAEQAAALVQERLGSAPKRVGKFPKCALIYRTDARFPKMQTRVFRLRDVSDEAKVEFLANGQQLACYNIHPDTGKAYLWNGAGEPLTTPRDALPLVTQSQLAALCAELDELLAEYGESIAPAKKAPKVDGDSEGALDAAALIAAVIGGAALHDSLRDLAGHWAAQGLTFKQICELLEGPMLASTIEHDERWKARYADIPRLVHSALEKFKKPEQTLQSIAFGDYVKAYVPADYAMSPIAQRGHVLAMTARTGGGKTAVATTLALHAAGDRDCGAIEVVRGLNILLLSGENDHDQQTRAIATRQAFGIDPRNRLRIIPGSYPIARSLDALRRDDEQHGPYGLVIADTSVAFFGGDEENDNIQIREHAACFREITRWPGRPTVLVLCHPIKNAGREDLIPRGGGAFLNEVDGNLTVWRDGERFILHTAGKFRGPIFDPLFFTLKTVELDGFHDAKGHAVKSVVAVPLSDHDAERLARQDWTDENRLLYEILHSPAGSIASWARSCCWTSEDGTPQKSKVAPAARVTENRKARAQRARQMVAYASRQIGGRTMRVRVERFLERQVRFPCGTVLERCCAADRLPQRGNQRVPLERLLGTAPRKEAFRSTSFTGGYRGARAERGKSMMTGSEAHEARMAALMRLTKMKDRYTKISVEFLLGRNVRVEEVQAALRDVEDARAELAALDATA